MQTNEPFDLNDIQHEPTDDQLENLMNSVIDVVKHRADMAHKTLMKRLREDIVAANLLHRQQIGHD